METIQAAPVTLLTLEVLDERVHDIEAVADIMTAGAELRAEKQGTSPWPNPYPPEKLLNTSGNDPWKQTLVAQAVILGEEDPLETEMIPVGTVTISTAPTLFPHANTNPWSDPNTLGIGRWATHPDYRRQRIGATMLNGLEAAISSEDHSVFTNFALHCAANADDLKAHYEQLGFVYQGDFERSFSTDENGQRVYGKPSGYKGSVYRRPITDSNPQIEGPDIRVDQRVLNTLRILGAVASPVGRYGHPPEFPTAKLIILKSAPELRTDNLLEER
jgi:ribosomal protein S18 acetylase RimI-like enzyme